MNEQIKALLNQVRILEEEANKHSGAERAELFKAAAKVKMEVIKLLPKQGKQPENKVPDPTEYFGAKLPEGFENYFAGDYLTPEIESYFDNLTPEQRDYFTVQVPDNVPDAPKQEPAKATKVFDDWEYRRKVFNALGIPC
ncbi:hypothetical protein [Escherichia coli]|uniref:hypothetical protein n=1 Tax=Escherichia coli TaxID=562 RepID=UPI0013028907|nr:hypothetical protein [Escherichia coli]ELH6528353.1 hypothetical protein [Escherichia coli]ELH6590462.1 hypothetical protein [Escherichia coli]KAE9713408.1 hypothetical protein GP714_22320 [Escherichia coli]KAE9830138.1 hypothetical protein GP674_22320 [Escherichia coli]